MYEGTRMAMVQDLSGIRQILLPLEEAGTLVRRTYQEVCTLALSYFCSTGLDIVLQMFLQMLKLKTGLMFGSFT